MKRKKPKPFYSAREVFNTYLPKSSEERETKGDYGKVGDRRISGKTSKRLGKLAEIGLSLLGLVLLAGSIWFCIWAFLRMRPADRLLRMNNLVETTRQSIAQMESTILPEHRALLDGVGISLSQMAIPGGQLDITIRTGVQAIAGTYAYFSTSFTDLSDGLSCKVKKKGWSGIPEHRLSSRKYSPYGEVLLVIAASVANDTTLIGSTLSGVVEGTGETTFITKDGQYSTEEASFRKAFGVKVFTRKLVRLQELRNKLPRFERSVEIRQAAKDEGRWDWDSGAIIGYCCLVGVTLIGGCYFVGMILLPFYPELVRHWWRWARGKE